MNRYDPVLGFKPPRIAMALVAIALLLHVLMPLTLHPHLPLPAAILGTAGIVLMLRAWWLFRSAGTAICPTDTPGTLITSDVYSFSRNPMYLAATLMLAAVAMYTGAAAVYAAAVVNFAILNRHFIPYEEERMLQRFGADFDRYRKRVRRWI